MGGRTRWTTRWREKNGREESKMEREKGDNDTKDRGTCTCTIPFGVRAHGHSSFTAKIGGGQSHAEKCIQEPYQCIGMKMGAYSGHTVHAWKKDS